MGTDKVFYTLSGVVDKSYLLCLLSLEVLVDKGIARIPHGCPKAVYQSLLKGSWPAQLNARTDVRLPLSLERDVGGPTEVATVSLHQSSVTGTMVWWMRMKLGRPRSPYQMHPMDFPSTMTKVLRA